MVNRQLLHETLFRGDEAIKTLSKSNVTLAGCGAIGSWASIILARMGVTRFRLIDKDVVEIHNVSTQLFTPASLGKSKVTVLQRMLYQISKARAETHKALLTPKNAAALLLKSNLVICSFDNYEGRLAVKQACLNRYPRLPALFVGMNGEHSYFECIWGENYLVPKDPAHAEIDPCDYPLSTTLVTLASTMTAEIAAQYLITGVKKHCRVGLNDLVT